MRVVYKPYMVKTMIQAINKAGFENREIEKIVITHEEMDQLRQEWDQPLVPYNKVTTFYGVPVEVRG